MKNHYRTSTTWHRYACTAFIIQYRTCSITSINIWYQLIHLQWDILSQRPTYQHQTKHNSHQTHYEKWTRQWQQCYSRKKQGTKWKHATSFTPEDCAIVGRYTTENGNAAPVKKSKATHRSRERTARLFKKRYLEEIKKRENPISSTSHTSQSWIKRCGLPVPTKHIY